MINSRLSLIRRKMADSNIDGLLVTSRENVYYLSGFSGTSGDLLITNDTAYILCDFRYKIQATQQAPMYIIKDVKAGIYKLVNELISLHRISRIGIEDRAVSYAAYAGMKNSLKKLQFQI